MENALQRVALRKKSLYLPDNQESKELSGATAYFLLHLSEKGYSLSETALHHINSLTNNELHEIIDILDDIYATDMSWTALTKDWLVPTGTTMLNRFVTAVFNAFPEFQKAGTTLPCGHFIPDGVFNLSRYNGCPFCGQVFDVTVGPNKGGHGRLTVLERMTDEDMRSYMLELLYSPVPLDATQADSLAILIGHYGLPENCVPAMHETRTVLSALLYSQGNIAQAFALLKSPDDVLRMLWYRQTDNARFKTVKEMVKATKNSHYFDSADKAIVELREKLKLHFSRKECALFARHIDQMDMTPQQMCENMHPKREMWVRLIRALRLGEYARRKELGKLSIMLKKFASGDYTVYNGQVEEAYIKRDAAQCLTMLQQRPGYFARCLFSAMLALGADKTISAFEQVAKDVPGRLLYSLASFADEYFMPDNDVRFIVVPGTNGISIPVNKLLHNYTDKEREGMVVKVRGMVLDELRRRYSTMPHGGYMYIAKELFEIPVPVSDRSNSIQDTGIAVAGQKFAVEGDKVRFFLHWGQGLPAQHLDMDLSAIVVYADGGRHDCAYYSLDFPGAVHSGDIQMIPDKVGAAEYIELDIPTLIATGARSVIFMGSLYTNGNIPENTLLGWMSSGSPMTVTKESGVAYDPADVQHLVRISSSSLSKAVIFGILDLDKKEINWLEIPARSQRAEEVDINGVLSYLRHLRNKITMGELLALQAEARCMEIISNEENATEAYTLKNPPTPGVLL